MCERVEKSQVVKLRIVTEVDKAGLSTAPLFHLDKTVLAVYAQLWQRSDDQRSKLTGPELGSSRHHLFSLNVGRSHPDRDHVP
jgi:hypothetical protein